MRSIHVSNLISRNLPFKGLSLAYARQVIIALLQRESSCSPVQTCYETAI